MLTYRQHSWPQFGHHHPRILGPRPLELGLSWLGWYGRTFVSPKVVGGGLRRDRNSVRYDTLRDSNAKAAGPSAFQNLSQRGCRHTQPS